MKTALLVLLGILVGGVIGVAGGGVIGTGLGVGAGIVTGLKAGACFTVEAAKEHGLITSEQIGDIFVAVSRSMDANFDPATAGGFPISDAQCQQVVADMKAAIAE